MKHHADQAKVFDQVKEQKLFILHVARDLIRCERCPYICWAIDDVVSGADHSHTADYKHTLYEAQNQLFGWIEMLLCGADHLEAWLCRSYSVSYDDLRGKYLYKMIETRLAWIDWMIKEIEK